MASNNGQAIERRNYRRNVTARRIATPAQVVSEFREIRRGYRDSVRGDYSMSRPSRFVRHRTGTISQGGQADWHFRNETQFYNDMEKARDMDRNDSIVGQIIDRVVANVVQEGFTLDFRTGSPKLDAILSQRWADEMENPEQCDLSGEHCWHDFERTAFRSMLVDGDCGISALWDENTLQFFEGHNIKHDRANNSEIVLGVLLDEFRRRHAYFIQRDKIGLHETTQEAPQPVWTRDEFGLRQFFHVYDTHRIHMTRGKTALHRIFEISGMLEDVQFAKLVQQQIASCFVILRSQAIGGPDLPSTSYGSEETITTATGDTRVLDNVAPGMEITGAPGETLSGFSPNIPNSEYFDHAKLLLQVIGVNFGLPLVLVLMDGSETNYSGWRGAVDEAKKGFRHQQWNLTKRLHEPLTVWKISRWLADDASLYAVAQDPKIDIWNFKWFAPNWPYIEPVQDAEGDIIRLKGGLTSPRRLHAERGQDFEDIVAEQLEDRAIAISRAMDAARRLAELHPEQPTVHWRELLSLHLPEGVNMQANLAENQGVNAAGKTDTTQTPTDEQG